MKKILAVLTVAFLMMGLAACASKPPNSIGKTSASESGTTSDESRTATEDTGSDESSEDTDEVILTGSSGTSETTVATASTTEKSNNKISLSYEKQATDILRQDNDLTRRLVYFKITNNNKVAVKDSYLYYKENGKAVKREIGLIYMNTKVVYETLWIDASFKGNLDGTIKNSAGTVLWEGTLSIQPPSSSYTVPKSSITALSDIKPMMLRGANYFNRYKCWGNDWSQSDFTKEWTADFKDFTEKLNVNTIRAFTIFKEPLRLQGYTPRSETLLKLCNFVEIAGKNKVKLLMCLYGGDPAISENMGDNLRFIRGIVEPFQNDGRILMWDLINEPDPDIQANYPWGDLGSGGYLDTFIKTMYPKLQNELAPKHVTCIGTGFKIEKLNKIGITSQVGSFHGYIPSDLPSSRVANSWRTAADTFWNGKKGAFMLQEWGYPSEDKNGVEDEAYQLKVYEGYLPAFRTLYEEGYNILGSYQWCIYDYPPVTNIVVIERKNGLIKEDGTVKPAGKYLAEFYKEFAKKVPAPWD
ncbi:MAG: hypothetical protein PHH84_05685 [Oscillospiraceae bacterium]|nr:hypothetical protein [Oscillospiraceae bacterium]MDD4413435.1 hypothetical protein [Oscillospiraceae bacterium]